MIDKYYKEGIKHINEKNQEYIAQRNRMTKKIIDGVDVSGCDFYFGGVCSVNGYDGCTYNTNCYYKQLKLMEYKLEKIKEICNKSISDHYKILLIINGGIVDE